MGQSIIQISRPRTQTAQHDNQMGTNLLLPVKLLWASSKYDKQVRFPSSAGIGPGRANTNALNLYKHKRILEPWHQSSMLSTFTTSITFYHRLRTGKLIVAEVENIQIDHVTYTIWNRPWFG